MALFDSIVGVGFIFVNPEFIFFCPHTRWNRLDRRQSQCPSGNIATQLDSNPISILFNLKHLYKCSSGNTLAASYLGCPGLPGLLRSPEAGDDLHEVVVGVSGQGVAAAVETQGGAPGDDQVKCHGGSFLHSVQSLLDTRQIPSSSDFNYLDIPNSVSGKCSTYQQKSGMYSLQKMWIKNSWPQGYFNLKMLLWSV